MGGIAGSASYAIRSCYSMGRITGKNNIGGIAGEGCDIFYSYRTMIWICPAKARAALPEKSVMMELCMATIMWKAEPVA